MNDELISNTQLRAYLFGELDEVAAEQLEEKCFVESDWQLALLTERDDLLDEWASGVLSISEAAKLEARMLQLPALRERAEFARSLHRHFTAPVTTLVAPPIKPHDARNWFSRFMTWETPWPLAASVAALLAVSGWLAWNTLRTPVLPLVAVQPSPSVTPAANGSSTGSVKELTVRREPQKHSASQTPAHNVSEPEVANFVLAVAALRGASDIAPTLAIPARAQTLRLQLELPPDTSSNKSTDAFEPQSAALLNAAGEIVRQQITLRLRRAGATRYVVCDVPVASLTEGIYQWRLTPAQGAEAVYPFAVKKSPAAQ